MGVFRFKQFSVDDSRSAMKIGTDGVLLGAWADARGARSIIDVGTGTGLIALMMAQRHEGVGVTGIDVDSAACCDAMANVAASPWAGRVEIMEADVLSWLLPAALAHPVCIVSNPPFYTEALRSPDSSRALARHGDGLGVESLLAWAARVMTCDADSLSFIAPAGRDDDLQYHMSLQRLAPVRITDVVSREGRPPVRRLYEVMRESAVSSPCRRDTLVIRNASGRYSEAYVSLTGNFYLDSTFG